MTDIRTRATEYLDLESQIEAARTAWQAAILARDEAVTAEQVAKEALDALVLQRGTRAEALLTAVDAEIGPTRG